MVPRELRAPCPVLPRLGVPSTPRSGTGLPAAWGGCGGCRGVQVPPLTQQPGCCMCVSPGCPTAPGHAASVTWCQHHVPTARTPGRRGRGAVHPQGLPTPWLLSPPTGFLAASGLAAWLWPPGASPGRCQRIPRRCFPAARTEARRAAGGQPGPRAQLLPRGEAVVARGGAESLGHPSPVGTTPGGCWGARGSHRRVLKEPPLCWDPAGCLAAALRCGFSCERGLGQSEATAWGQAERC